MNFPGEQLVIKLWETVAEKGVGSLFRPWQMRREGRASIELKRDELLQIAQAERDAEKIRRGDWSLVDGHSTVKLLQIHASETPTGTPDVEQELLSAASALNTADTIRREANVTRALLHAEEALENDQQEPPEANVDDDWIYRWRSNASEVSMEELQDLWGRLLAGEVKAPGTYSLRTLEFLRNVSKQEAEAIAKLSRFVIEGIIYREASELLEGEGINFGFLLYMQQLGVVAGVEAVGLKIQWNSVDQTRFVKALKSNSKVLVISADDAAKTIVLPAYQLTAIGQQVLSLGHFDPHMEYLRKVGEKMKGQGFQVELADFVDVSANKIRYFNGQKL